MALTKFERNMKIVAALDDEPNDVGGLSAAELKAKFDEGGEALQEYINSTLLPALEDAGVLAIVRSDDLTALKFLRLNADKVLETSTDGVNWEATGSSGHLILDKNGMALPQRSRMQFANCEVSDDGTVTVVRGVKGDKGDTGAQGVQGVKGDTGAQGPTGKAIIPSVDQDTGLMSFSIGEAGAVPASVYVRGPQGPQGVQGQQGGVGPQGPYGPQGLPGDPGQRGAEGPQGPRGAQGEQGAQGPIGLQGPQGLRGDKGDKGDKGDTGDSGPQGALGTPGIQGNQGPRGEQGIQGPAGVQGAQGIQGAKGDRGLDGRSFEIKDVYLSLSQLQAAHPTGASGAYQVSANMELYIWSEANLAWQSIGALEGPQGPQGPQGVQGSAGPQGEIGAQGVQGVQGPKGDTGPQGAKGDKGDKGDTGPKGDKGDTGAQGIQGIQGPIGAQGPQGDQGIQGAKGDTGAVGPKGDPGAKGSPGAAGTNGKSAYQQAAEGGYTGTEAQFKEILSTGPWLPTTGGTMTGDLDLNGNALNHAWNVVTDLLSISTPAYPIQLHGTSSDGVGSLSVDCGGSEVVIGGVGYPYGDTDAANKQYVDEKVDSKAAKYGTCSTSMGTATKTVTASGFSLVAGAIISVKFTYINTAKNPTMNVNGTGAKYIYNCNTGTYIKPGDITAGMTAQLVYNGSQWVLMNQGGDEKPFVVGSYVGDGNSTKNIELGFMPTAVLVSLGGSFADNSTNSAITPTCGLAIAGLHAYSDKDNITDAAKTCEITGGGFRVFWGTSGKQATNANLSPYYYIAFRG